MLFEAKLGLCFQVSFCLGQLCEKETVIVRQTTKVPSVLCYSFYTVCYCKDLNCGQNN